MEKHWKNPVVRRNENSEVFCADRQLKSRWERSCPLRCQDWLMTNYVKFFLYSLPMDYWEKRGVTPKWLSFHHAAERSLKVEIKFGWEIRDESYISCKLAMWTEIVAQTPVIFWYSATRYDPRLCGFSLHEKDLRNWWWIKLRWNQVYTVWMFSNNWPAGGNNITLCVQLS